MVLAAVSVLAWSPPAGAIPRAGADPPAGAVPPADRGAPPVPPWVATSGAGSAVYALPGTREEAMAGSVADLLDNLLRQIERDSGLTPDGVLIYPLFPSPERLRRDWWQFAILRDGTVNGWGTVVEGDNVLVSPYQIARIVARQGAGRAVPLLSWGLGDLIADRLVGVDSHAHARLFLERGGLPPVAEIVHQLDFSRALPGAYAQSVSFLAYLAEEHGLRHVAAFAQVGGVRWYDFPSLFQRHFGISIVEADRRWRARLSRTPLPRLSDADFLTYRRGVEYVCAYTLAQSPGRLVSRPGGATAYVEALRATGALRRFDITGASRAVEAGRKAGEQVQRRASRTRSAVMAALWALGLGPVVLAVILLAGPALRDAWRRRRRRRVQTRR
ncbi:MAG: hypothetical protein QME77_10485 [bacterium]|nr:hypothetical protein [bacterium]